MIDEIEASNFVRLLRSEEREFTDRDLRRFLFAYCKRYQETYWFNQLENAFAFIEFSFEDEGNLLDDELPRIIEEVEEAEGEYFESLNEVATAVRRLLDSEPISVGEFILAIDHVWNAYDCNESSDVFVSREDSFLCDLLANFLASDADKI